MTFGEIVGVVMAGVAIITVVITLLALSSRLGKMAGALEAGLQHQNVIISELKDEVVSLRKVITDIAVFRAELGNLTQQVNRLDKTVDELRHGEGYVFPLTARIPAPG